ncbi:MAG: hypothetical protein KKE44_18430 [Proteobacteria bacterium]|nr:hypothetical protein [Pseudomonadota bacterium]MBU1584711.1 hypothetical protein [Pseudomonadota bacterium]
MKSIIPIAGCLLMLLSLGACVSSTETDPRKGGLFGYNPAAYEKRIEERKTKLAATEADTQKAKQESQQLESSKQEKQTRHEALKTKLAALYSESGKLENQLKKTKTANASQNQALKRLQDGAAALKADTIKTNNSDASDAAKQARIEQLQKRMDELLKEAEALSSL